MNFRRTSGGILYSAQVSFPSQESTSSANRMQTQLYPDLSLSRFLSGNHEMGYARQQGAAREIISFATMTHTRVRAHAHTHRRRTYL